MFYGRAVISFITLVTVEVATRRNDQCEWQCKNGLECIENHQVCDGERNCRDGSDETSGVCMTAPCPRYAFRCAYGGCISRKAECDKKQDCADNSDELTLKCLGVTYNLTRNTACDDEEFQCNSGACISTMDVCDGTQHCVDGSDEIVDYCASAFCPSYAFRCGYGGCIKRTAKCDGTYDCVDRSDENTIMCGYREESEALVTPLPDDSSCLLVLPKNVKAFYFSPPQIEISNQTIIGTDIEIIYECDSKRLALNGEDYNMCDNGAWFYDVPHCKKTGCSADELLHVSITATCEYNNQDLDCATEVLKPTTKVSLKCSTGYRERLDKMYSAVISCGSDLEWSRAILRCEAVCGEPSEGWALIVGGAEVNNTPIPWHAGIYSRFADRTLFSNTCGGTIITAKFVISAAHCFWDENGRTAYNASMYRVGVGKVYRDFSAIEHHTTQILEISEIILPRGYFGHFQRQLADIAMLRMANFITFQSYVMPICMEYNLEYSERYMPAHQIGIVAGWGLTKSGGDTSEKLKWITLPTVDLDFCMSNAQMEFRQYIVYDKFCAGYINGQSVCQGDSGGGLVFPRRMRNKIVYYLGGIVSAAETKRGSCNDRFYTLFTNVRYFQEMILELVLE